MITESGVSRELNNSTGSALTMRPGLVAVFTLAAGIVAGRQFAGATLSTNPLIALVVLAIAISLFICSDRRFKLVLAALFILGAGLIIRHDHASPPYNHVSMAVTGEPVDITGEIISLDSVRTRSDRYLVSIHTVDGKPVRGTGGMYVSRQVFPEQALPGDMLRLENVTLRQIRGFHNIGGWSYENFMRDRGIDILIKISRSSRLAVTGSRWTWRRPFEKLKNDARKLITAGKPDVRAAMEALLTGEQGHVTPELRDTFARAGTSHLLAVSGLHVGFVAAASYFALRIVMFIIIYPIGYRWASFGLPMRLAAAGALVVVIGFTFFTGPRLPALRAGIMIGVYLVAVIFGRGRDFYGAFSLAMAIILLTMPWSLFTAGFNLSFSAVFFITVFLEKWWKPMSGMDTELDRLAPPWWKRALSRYPATGSYAAVSLFAMIGSAPIAALHFNTVPLYSVVVNSFLVPITSVTVPIGLLGLALHSGTLISITASLTDVVVTVSRSAAGLPFSFVHVANVPPLFMVSYYAAIAVLLITPKGAVRRGCLIGVSSVGLISLAMPPTLSLFDKTLTVRFLDVGQGDCTLAIWPKGGALAIDGGNRYPNFDVGRSVIAPVLWNSGRLRFNAIFATHGDADHIGGMQGLADKAHADLIADHGLPSRHPLLASLRSRAQMAGVYRKLKAGDRLVFPGGLAVDVLNPPSGPLPYADKVNNRSLALKLTYGAIKILAVGDIGRETERWLVESGADLRADVLKVAHHGSNSSSSERFLRAVGARYAVISVGYNNHHGHPHPKTLERLRNAGMTIYRTDRDGEVVITTDGVNIEIKTYESTMGK